MVKKNLTRKNLSDEIHKILGFSKNFSSTIIDDFFETLISELIKSNKIKISSFGTFKIMNKMERMGRNNYSIQNLQNVLIARNFRKIGTISLFNRISFQ